jgi:hypothetical protein
LDSETFHHSEGLERSSGCLHGATCLDPGWEEFAVVRRAARDLSELNTPPAR